MGELKQHQPPMTIDEQEEKYNDKSIIHLPRQYTYVAVPICVECLILLGFSRVRGKWKVRFRPSLDHLKCVRNKTKNIQMGALLIFI